VSRRLPPEDFLRLVDHAPLVSIDLLVRNREGQLLVGLRRNAPAAGTYFVPGGRIAKGLSHEQALREIAERELGLPGVEWEDRNVEGIFTHAYEDNALGVPGVSTHYVVIAYGLRADDESVLRTDDQHSHFTWVDADSAESLEAPVHPYTLAYLRR
jgi:colanic acid biosynthesis protein WcaH